MVVLTTLFWWQTTEAATPRQIVLTIQENPQTSMTITWRTDHEGADSRLAYSVTGEDSFVEAMAETSTFEETKAWIHSVKLNNLKPATSYTVIVETDGVKADAFTFRTAPSESEDLIFVIGADAQHLQTQMDVIKEVFKKAASEDPDLFIYSGDFVNAELSEYEWDLFFDLWHDVMITEEGRRIPLVPTIGNHEVVAGFGGTKDLAVYYYNRLKLPQPETYHVTQYGPDFTIISLDSNHTSTIEEQIDWLETTLETHQESLWTLVHYHVGSWWGGDLLDAKIRSYLVPLFEEYGVDIVHSGHYHTYYRTPRIFGVGPLANKVNGMIADGLQRALEDFDPEQNYAPPLQKNLLQLSRGNWETVGFTSIEEGFKELAYMLALFTIQTDEPVFAKVFEQVASTKLYENFWAMLLDPEVTPNLIDEDGILYLVGGGLGSELSSRTSPENYWWLEESQAEHHYRRLVLEVEKNQLRVEPVFYNPAEDLWYEVDATVLKK